MELKPEDLIAEAWIPTYKQRIRVLHNQLVQIRSTEFILEHVAKFPFDLFGEHDGPFWNLVRRSLETAVVVGLWRVLFDSDGDSLTLRQLKNQVMANAVDDSARQQVAQALRSQDVDKRINQIEQKIRVLRHEHFAHLDAAAATGASGTRTAPRVTFDELRELATAAHDLLNAVGMGTYYMTLYPQYDPTVTRGGERIKPDVEAMLDDIVARSEDIRLPETKPDEFPFYWKYRKPEEREAFNKYRRKFGLPEVPPDD